MLVADLRRRLSEKVEEVAASGDEEGTAIGLTCVRAVLVALAGHPGDADVDLQGLTVGSARASLILGLHPEYVRSLIRRGELRATKENGEFSIAISDLVDYMAKGIDPRVPIKLFDMPVALWQAPKAS